MVLKYLRDSFRRKRARRVTAVYPTRVEAFEIPDLGRVEFANWENPLARRVSIDRETIDFFRQFIDPGDFVIDIGANVGDTTVPMGLAAGPDGLTLGFDPNPYVFSVLERNAALNPGKARIVPLPFAISKKEEEFFFVSSEASFANGGLSRTRDSRHGRFVHPEKVRSVNLPELLRRDYAEWLEKLRFIKIDAEGHDVVILEAIADLIDTYRPTVVAEVFEKDTREGRERLYRALDRPGYALRLFKDFDVRSELRPVTGPADIIEPKKTVNICATPT